MNYKINTFLSTVYLQDGSKLFRVFTILIVFLLSSSCSSPPNKAPISIRSQPPSTKAIQHIVAPGETLYSIAWRYGLDYKGLAEVNKVGSLNKIYPSQVLLLKDKPSVIQPGYTSQNKARERKSVISNKALVKQAPPAKTAITKVPSTQKNSKPIAKARPEKKSSPVSIATNKPIQQVTLDWLWPAKGKVITNFHLNKGIKKGIDIQGKKGESVHSAAAGEVVYAGAGIRGYGKLIIIKHNAQYLSAYAHNNSIRVKEGDVVRSGQHIADIGATGVGVNGKPKLHFQIRRNGKPIDPLPLLPKRKS